LPSTDRERLSRNRAEWGQQIQESNTLGHYNDVLFRAFQPAFLAELGIMLWLLVVGAKESALTIRASAGRLE
jgi:hypothetical protein